MKRIFTVFFCLSFILCAASAQRKCLVNGPANVRQSTSSKSAITGQIADYMAVEVTHVTGDWWRINNVYDPHAGRASSGSVIGYYTHRQNLRFDTAPDNTFGQASPLVGTWACHVRTHEVISFQLNSNGTGKILSNDSSPIKWSRSGNSLYFQSNGSGTSESMQILGIHKNVLVLYDSRGTTLYFTKVK